MKHLILIFISLAALNTFAQAHPNPGDAVTHNLLCGGVRDKVTGELSVGVSYSMKCSMQALAPQYSLRSCELYVEAVVPDAVPSKIEINMKIQSDHSAYFESADKHIRILVEKEHLNATVEFNDREEMKCSADQQPN